MSESTPSISILIPCHNHAAFIERAVDSALGQSRSADEIVVVDDGSTDGSPEILRRYGDRIRLVARDNRGIAATCNQLVELSRGDALAFLESDDALDPDYLARCWRFLDHEGVAWLSTARRVIDAGGRPTGEIIRKNTRGDRFTTEGILHRDIGLACTPVVRRDALRDIGPFSTDYRGAMDVEISLRFSTRYAMGYLDEPLYLYRRHGANLSGESLRDSREILEILRRFQNSDWAREHPSEARAGLARFVWRVAKLRMRNDPSVTRRDVLSMVSEARRLHPWSPRYVRHYLGVWLFGIGASRAAGGGKSGSR